MSNFIYRFLSAIILCPLFIFALYNGKIFFYFFLIIIIILCCYEIYTNIKQSYLSFFLYILIFFFSFSLLKIRGLDETGFIISLWISIIVWFSDIGGYFVGKSIGGKNFSKYSPNKTISGLLGSIVFSQFSIFVINLMFSSFQISIKAIIYQFLLCIIAVYGDIFFSYIKRKNNIKDYSNLIPGHGGVLDRIDGMIIVFIFYYLLSLLDFGLV